MFNHEINHLSSKGNSVIPIFLMDPKSESLIPSPLETLLEDIKENITQRLLKERIKNTFYSCIVNRGLLGILWPMIIHPKYHYFTIFDLTIPSHLPKFGYVLVKNLIRNFTIGYLFNKNTSLVFINLALTS